MGVGTPPLGEVLRWGCWPAGGAKGRGKQDGREVSPGPIKCVYSARRIYGSHIGWRLGQGAVCWVWPAGR